MKNWKLDQKQDLKTDQKLGTGPKKDAKRDRFQTKAVLLSINMPLCVFLSHYFFLHPWKFEHVQVRIKNEEIR